MRIKSCTNYFSARRGRLKKVRKSLESTLLSKIELMESYAKVIQETTNISLHTFQILSSRNKMLNMLLQLCSMIEIEVEMDSDVLVAEAATGAVSTLILPINSYNAYLKYHCFCVLIYSRQVANNHCYCFRKEYQNKYNN